MKIDETLLYKEIGRRLKERRLALGLTQEQLAEASDVLRTSITNLEAGRQKTPLHVLYELCAVLEIEIVELLPKRSEVSQKETVSIEIGGRMAAVPPKSAEILQKLMNK
jgi:transcriptional regulator with XRE-family HTH domain